MILYSYCQSSTSYRVRIVLNLKRLPFDYVPVNLFNGEQKNASYAAVNPSLGVPALKLANGQIITQSMAIIGYLEAMVPEPPLVPHDPLFAAKVHAAAHVIASDIHPVNNLKLTSRLRTFGVNDSEVKDWMRHWMREGLTAYSALIEPAGDYSFGNEVSLADVLLIPQLYNAHRWGLDMSQFPRLLEIEKNSLALDAFNAAKPANQPDAL